ncbi:hypothetical protein ACHAXT_003005 [Thalassiosira profunda]
MDNSSRHSSTADSDATPPREGLVNTSSFARRVAKGTPNDSDRKILQISGHSEEGVERALTAPPLPMDETEGDAVTFVEPAERPHASGRDVKRSVSVEGDATLGAPTTTTADNGGSMAEADSSAIAKEADEALDDMIAFHSEAAAPPPSPTRPSLGSAKTVSKVHDDNNGGLGEYIAWFFSRAESLEEQLEVQQSQRDLMDKQRHGVSRKNLAPMSPEGGSSSESSIEDGANVTTHSAPPVLAKTPPATLTRSMEARAAVDAMSNFLSLTEAQNRQLSYSPELQRQKEPKEKHSFEKEDEEHEPKKQKKVAVEGQAPDKETRKEWKRQWEAFVSEKKKDRFPEVLIQASDTMALPLTVDEFYQYVLEDDALHSFVKFMRDIGELDVDATQWEPSQMPTATKPATRIIHYVHPVNAPMAPPTAKARKQQSLHKFGSAGLCLETCTVVEDVPMADCFVVEDRLWVHEAENGTEGCTVAVTFQIRFVKGTMFRRIIESTTRKEYESYWNQFADRIRGLKGPSALEVDELEEVAMELEEATAMLEGEEGQEVPLRSALSRIRQSSRRLSGVVRLTSSKKLAVKEEPGGIGVRWAVAMVLDGISHLRKRYSDSDGFAVACGIVVFLVVLNVQAWRQILQMNRSFYELNATLVQLNEVNAALLSQLASGNVDGACPG